MPASRRIITRVPYPSGSTWPGPASWPGRA